jgi:membrane protease YdiL (CAAX protease family)
VLGFVILDLVAQFGLGLALGISRAVRSPMLPNRLGDPLDASGIGLPLWSLLFGFFGWFTLLLVVGYTALASHGLERRKVTELGLRWTRHVASDAAAGLALAAVLFISVVGVGLRLGWYRIAAITDPVGSLATLLVGFLILLPFAAVEEVSMRGFVQHAAARSWGKWGGLLASSLVFAALHLRNPELGSHPLAVVGLFLAGLYLGSAALITGDLWLAIFLHTGWNLMEGPFFGLPVSGMEVPAAVLRTHAPGADLLTGGTFGPEAGLLLCLLMVVHLAVLWSLRPLLTRRLASPPPEASAPAEAEVCQALSVRR